VKKDLYTSLFWLLFATYYSLESYGYGLGKWSRPGPGYFPFGAGLLFGMISLYVFLRALRNKPAGESPGEPSERFQWQNIVLVVAGMLGYAFLLKRMGFILCTFLIVVLFIRVIAKKRWLNSIVTAGILAVVFHIFFNTLLKAQLPNGLFRFLLD